jgi:CheY-like chemotaxis protein
MIAETVLESMRREGYAIDWAQDGRAAELSLGNGAYDLVLLDIGLPGKDGIEVLSHYRRRGGGAPVIMLTARDAVNDRVRGGRPTGLDAGAIRHTPQGGRVDVVLNRTANLLGFEVVDNGPGIPERELDRVLDRFYRGEHTRGTGNGLGLAIAARIARRQQLTLSLRNNVDAGGLTVSVSGFIPTLERVPATRG